MITCHIRYVSDPFKLEEFEHYARLWIPLVEELGGEHHGYFLPAEGANNVAICLFSFPSLARYEAYREASRSHAGCQAAFAYAEQTRCVASTERTVFRPVFA
jgi:NIPSNAP